MSWHTCGLLIKDDIADTPEECFARLGLMPLQFDEFVDFDEAVSLELVGKAYAYIEGWHVIFDPMLFFDLDENPTADGSGFVPDAIESGIAKSGLNSIVFLLEGSSGTYGISQYVDGRIVRCLLVQEDEILQNEGTPLPFEQMLLAESQGDYEQFILMFAQKLALNFDKLQNQQFRVYS
jgi:hypothetical protein